MKYVITTSIDDSNDTRCGTGLPIVWTFDTNDPKWRDDLPDAPFFITIVEEFEQTPRTEFSDQLERKDLSELLEKARAWKAQGSRSKWRTESSLALWDLVDHLEKKLEAQDAQNA